MEFTFFDSVFTPVPVPAKAGDANSSLTLPAAICALT